MKARTQFNLHIPKESLQPDRIPKPKDILSKEDPLSSLREKLKSLRTNENVFVFVHWFVISRRKGSWGGSWLF